MSAYSKLSDAELISLLKLSNRNAYTEIYKRYTALLYHHAYSKLQNREEARDIVQELFVTIWLKREDLNICTNLAGYLYNAIRNRVLNKIAHQQVESHHLSSLRDFIIKQESITDFLVREKELTFIIESEIARLPAKMREIFMLSRKASLSHKEIASQLSLSEKTVKNQVNNALKILKVKLGSRFSICFF